MLEISIPNLMTSNRIVWAKTSNMCLYPKKCKNCTYRLWWQYVMEHLQFLRVILFMVHIHPSLFLGHSQDIFNLFLLSTESNFYKIDLISILLEMCYVSCVRKFSKSLRAVYSLSRNIISIMITVTNLCIANLIFPSFFNWQYLCKE